VTEQAEGVEFDFPAELRYLPVARAATAALALVHDLTLPDLADLRLAVDEMCATLIPLAAPGARTLLAGRLRQYVRGRRLGTNGTKPLVMTVVKRRSFVP
jgi:hypothetical protein